METPTKNPILSLTIQGALISLLPVLAGYFKIDLGDVDGLVKGIASLLGLVMTVYGRIRAVKRIVVLPTLK